MSPRRPSILLALLAAALFAAACSAGATPPPAATSPGSTAVPATTPAAPPSPTAAPPPPAPALPPAFSGAEALRQVQELADRIGTRASGGPKEAEAATYIDRQFAAQGYQVRQQLFDFDMYEATGSKLTERGGAEIANGPLYFSGGGQVSAPVVAAGIGRPEDFPRGGLEGAIALIERGTLTFADKMANATAAGAGGVIIYNNAPGRFDGNLGRAGSTIPAVSITQEDGRRLAAAASPVVTLEVQAGRKQFQSRNVIAQAGPACRVVIGSHYDSVPAGPGANDNASGTGAVIELARVLKPAAAQKQLCFIAFGSEELGLWGSRRYVESLSPAEKDGMTAMINLDMVGVGDTWRLFGSDGLGDLALQSARAAGVAVDRFSGEERSSGGGSDHAPFIQAGIPAVFIHLQTDPNYHTAEDRAVHIKPASLEQAGRIAVELVNRLPETR